MLGTSQNANTGFRVVPVTSKGNEANQDRPQQDADIPQQPVETTETVRGKTTQLSFSLIEGSENDSLESPSPPGQTPSKAVAIGHDIPVKVESAKFDLGQTQPVDLQLDSVDEGLAELADGYGQTTIVLMPRDPSSAYAYWDIPNEEREKLRKQGGEQLALRFYDVTNIDMDRQRPHSVRQYECEEMAREWYIEVPISDRDYIVEIGYVTEKGRWLILARSFHVRIPPVYPCDWYGDDFRTVNWDDNLRSRS